MKKILCAFCATGALVLATPSNAQLTSTGTDTATINTASSGGSITLDFNGNVGGTIVPGLTSELTLTLLGISQTGGTTVLDFGYSLANTSTVVSRTSGFAFDTSPLLTSGAIVDGGLFNTLNLGGNYPNGIGTVDLCLLSNPGSGGSCAGGSNGGVLNGSSGTGEFTLTFADTPATINLSDFAVRYQSIVGVTAGDSGTGTPIPRPVPEPATWAMMILGFAGIGWTVGRRRKVASLPQLA